VILQGPNTRVDCKILLSRKPRNSTKTGKGWRYFCTENGLKEGDIVLFEMHNNFMNMNIEVFINGSFLWLTLSIFCNLIILFSIEIWLYWCFLNSCIPFLNMTIYNNFNYDYYYFYQIYSLY